MRILLTGGVGTGKTTLARDLAELTGTPPVLATDDALWLPEVAGARDPWSAANAAVARWIITRGGPWIIEGVRVPMALAVIMRERGRTAPLPFDPPLIYLTRAIHYETKEQAPMTAAVASAVLHCERRLCVPVRRARYVPGLAKELVNELGLENDT